MILSENKWTVYCHTNKFNNKKYVGITSKSVNARWKNGKGYKTSPHFNSAIKKYGWDNFKHEILLSNLTREEAEQKEKEYISKWNLTDKNFGYNLTEGGEGTSGYKVSEKAKRKMSERMKGENHPFYGKKMSKEFCLAVSNGRKGIKFTEEHKNNLRKSHLGARLSEEHKNKIRENSPNKVKVICLETLEVFDSISDVSIKFNKEARHISECCKRKRQTWNKLHWMYYEEYLALKGGENDCRNE